MGNRFSHYDIDQFLRKLGEPRPSEVDFHTKACEQCRLVEALVRRVWGPPTDEDSEVLLDQLRSP